MYMYIYTIHNLANWSSQYIASDTIELPKSPPFSTPFEDEIMFPLPRGRQSRDTLEHNQT